MKTASTTAVAVDMGFRARGGKSWPAPGGAVMAATLSMRRARFGLLRRDGRLQCEPAKRQNADSVKVVRADHAVPVAAEQRAILVLAAAGDAQDQSNFGTGKYEGSIVTDSGVRSSTGDVANARKCFRLEGVVI